jgi:uncharacterized protein YggE
MKTLSTLLSLLVLLALVGCSPALALGSAAAPLAAQPALDTPAAPRTISVTGSAQVMVVPDEVALTLGVETSDLQLAMAKARNDVIVKKVLDVTKTMGIDPKNVQTDYMNIQPRYDSAYTKPNFIGYFVQKNIVITLKDVSKFEDLLSQVLVAGVNYVHSVDFRTTALRKYRDQARDLALKAAQEKAQAMASTVGQQVGQPLSVREDYNRWYYPWNSWWGGGYGSQMSQNVIQNSGQAAPDSEGSLALGQIAVSASVSVDFELK